MDTETTYITRDKEVPKIEFYAYQQLGVDVFSKPEADEKNLFLSLDAIAVGTEVFIQHPFTDGWWKVVVDSVADGSAQASGEVVMASLNWLPAVKWNSPKLEIPAHWVSQGIGDIRALSRVEFN